MDFERFQRTEHPVDKLSLKGVEGAPQTQKTINFNIIVRALVVSNTARNGDKTSLLRDQRIPA